MSHRRKLVIAVGIVMLVFTGIWVATLHIAPENDVEKYKKALIAKGEKLEISEVLPPPVPPGQNGVDAVNHALGMLTPMDYEESNLVLAMRMIAPSKAIVCFQQPDVRSDDSTNSWTNIMAVGEADRPATELLKQAMNFPVIDFQIDYTNWPEMPPLLFVRPLMYGAHRLSAEAICDLHVGDTESAVTNICALLTLANRESDERVFIAQTIRRATASLAASANWELLQSSNINDGELAMLQRSWEPLGFIRGAENTVLMDRARLEATIKKMETSGEYFNRMMDGWGEPVSVSTAGDWREQLRSFWQNSKLGWAKSMYHSSWIYSDELQMLQNDQLILETLRVAETNGFFDPSYTNAVTQIHEELHKNRDDWRTKLCDFDYHLLFSEEIETKVGIVRRTMAAEAMRQILITAIALKRYQLKYGNYPINLSSLVPEFVTTVPIDPVDGKPLRYRSEADGAFLLYSIGNNGVDDGGDGSLEKGEERYSEIYWLDPNTLDWVWPQPATAAEIQYYYAQPPN